MNQYKQMILFVLVLGVITSSLLVGVDALTRDRIARNQEAELQSAILDAYNIPYTFTEISNIFEENVDVVEVSGFTFFVDPTTGAVSFRFEGSGLWGPIVGVLTLESDFETIKRITVLQEEETPGLGGIVSERQYLDTFVGRVMTPTLIIQRNANLSNPNEVDAITGATGTSNAFKEILNAVYEEALNAWESRN